jgi:hypothetical protein
MPIGLESSLKAILDSANGGRRDGSLDLDDVGHSIHHADSAGEGGREPLHGGGFGVFVRLGRAGSESSSRLSHHLTIVLAVRDGDWITVGAADSSGRAIPALNFAWPIELEALGSHVNGWRQALCAWARRSEGADRVRIERDRAMSWVRSNARRFRIPSGRFALPVVPLGPAPERGR